MLPLPTPERGGTLASLRPFLNTKDGRNWMLCVGWLLQALRPTGPYPVLALSGVQGSAKSMTARFLRSIIDPHETLLRRPPREDRELAIAAGNSWVLAYDNVSRLPEWFSDALCCLSTGGGFAARQLFTDCDEHIISYERPVQLTSIEDVVERSNLLDRTLLAEMTAIAAKDRRTEKALWRAFHRAQPLILAGLLDVVVGALRASTLSICRKCRGLPTSPNG